MKTTESPAVQHTATPWRSAAIAKGRIIGDATTSGAEKYQILGANCTVASVYRPNDAAFIVRACNSHEALLDIVARLARLSLYGGIEGETKPDGEDAMRVLDWHITYARKTLASLGPR